VKTLPKFLDLKPLRIDYTTKRNKDNADDKAKTNNQAGGSSGSKAGAHGEGGAPTTGQEIRVWALGEVNPEFEAQEGFSKRAPIQTTLGEEWHAFYDLRGVKYYYNFATGESMRRPHQKFINPEEQPDDKMAMSKEVAEIVRQLSVSKDDRKLQNFALKLQDKQDQLALGGPK